MNDDLRTYGISITRGGKRIDPRDFYRKPPWWARLWTWLRGFLPKDHKEKT